MSNSKVIIPKGPRPHFPVHVQMDKAHTGAVELDMAHHTNAMWVRNSFKRMHWVWMDPNHAPVAALTTANTFVTFSLPDGGTGTLPTIRLPWYMHPRATGLIAELIVGSDSRHPFAMRLTSRQMISTVASSNGATSQVTVQKTAVSPVGGMWTVNAHALGITTFHRIKCTLFNPTLPSDNLFALSVQAKYAAASFLSNVGGESYSVYLYSMLVEDSAPGLENV